MQLTVLGKYGPYAKTNGGTSSYLVSNENTNILVDAGSGSISRLQNYCSLKQIDIIIISHLHYDHMAEMLILQYALKEINADVYIPNTPETQFNLLKSFNPKVIDEGTKIKVNDFDISFCKAVHPVETYSIKIKENDRIFVYSSDSTYNKALETFSNKADVLLIDSGFLQKGEGLPHMCVEEAAKTAKNAEVGNLILTHINPNYEESAILENAKATFNNSIIAEELKTYII